MSSVSWRSSNSAPSVVECGERLVEHEKLGLVQERTAESEPLCHAARVRRDTFGANVPEAEALEQHADPLPPLGHAVETPVEIEVLERRQIAIEKRLVTDEAELAAGGVDVERRHPSVRRVPRQSRSSVVLPDPFAPVTTRKLPRSRSRSSGFSARRRP